MVYQDNRLITLNSQDGTKINGTYLSNIQFNFNGLLKDDRNLIRSYITVLNCQIPVSFYIIDETNNYFEFLTGISGPTYKTYVPVGNYNGNQLVTALNNIFQINGVSVVCSLDTLTGLLSFSISSLALYLSSNSTIKKILGYDTLLASSFFLTLPYQLNLLGKKKLFINSYNLRNSAYTSKNVGFVQTIATIPVDQPPYNMINYVSATDLEKVILSNRSLDTIDIQIFDEDNNYINFRNINWSITLCLTVEKIDLERLDYSLNNLPIPTNDKKEDIEKTIMEEKIAPGVYGQSPKKLSRDEKELKLLES
jgi:hypothetical protein